MLEKLGADDTWPTYDEKYLITSNVNLIVQVNGKLRANLQVSLSDLANETKLIQLAKNHPKVAKYLQNDIKKTVFVKTAKLLNFVV